MFFIVIVSVFYIKLKAGSAFIVTNKFIMLFVRKKPNINNGLIDDILEIEAFNFQYNTRAVSIRQKNKFEAWIRKYELDFRMIVKLKKNLNIDTLKVKKVKERLIFLLAITAMIIFLSMSKTLEIAVKPAGLIKIDGSGWFWFNNQRAENYNFWGKSGNLWDITPKNCSEKNFNIKLPDKVISTICSSFNEKRDIDYISNLIKRQGYFFGGLLGLSLMVIFYTLSVVLSLTMTYDIRKMILHKVRRYRRERSYTKNKSINVQRDY